MIDLLQKVGKELQISKERLVTESIRCFLEIELRNLSIEINKIGEKYGVTSFDGLWEKLETGNITESECFDDLSRIEFLEIEKDKVKRLLTKAA
ncbi:MAG: hypothetical protein ACUZ8O_10210 [Candidatus Anammoxibacter sp.]